MHSGACTSLNGSNPSKQNTPYPCAYGPCPCSSRVAQCSRSLCTGYRSRTYNPPTLQWAERCYAFLSLRRIESLETDNIEQNVSNPGKAGDKESTTIRLRHATWQGCIFCMVRPEAVNTTPHASRLKKRLVPDP